MHPFIQDLAEANHYQPTRLLHLLREIQARYHHIPSAAIEQLAELLTISRTHIIGVIEFYSFFHLTPRGHYELLVSDSITDHMLGKIPLLDYLSTKLEVAVGQVRNDGLVSLDNTSCTGMCDQGPAGLINGYALTHLSYARIDQLSDLINQQIPLDKWPTELFLVEDNIQKTDLLLNNPIQIGAALIAMFNRGTQETLAEINLSELRGRGGAGYKTAWKWHLCYEGPEDDAFCDVATQRQQPRYVVCKADEGEPGTFKDRVLLNSYAHQVLEGMTLCAAIIGAEQGFLYLRGEYLFLYEKLQNTLKERREAGLLGQNILNKGLNFDIEICLGAGAYICGEESALIESLEGKMGIPRNRPPYPVTQGYLGKPTVVNNVETFLAAASISVHGGEWFAAIGTEKSKGTKLLSICGDCERPAGFSPFWIRQILRQELKFNGTVFSDDLSMAGAATAGDYPDRARLAQEAGCDMLLVCNNPVAAEQVLDSLPITEDPLREQRLRRMQGKPGDSKACKNTEKWQQTSLLINQLIENHA